MTVLGIRFCTVRPDEEARALAQFLGADGLGLAERDLGMDAPEFAGAVFPAGEHSWAEIWAASEAMPEGVMLHIIVGDADAYAERARNNGIALQGPVDAHGERIYFAQAPGGLAIAILSRTDS
ncbi:VOC family protein [Stakelama tenebrarum]|uniref:VOC domain-containing protein n=1 Tax=Stakelama tenebrarum TaxID=2711215 RepID=A0A6G6Y2H5_9SPHN|nr:hypothetical protein [Sphingosinithalassobacter tenebrarum]QIG79125.1 hypothetical protein G5C33_04535 [Sphingosinithalassobacter tenebrarum]